MIVVNVPQSIVNTAGLAGDQANAKSIALPDGGFPMMSNDPAAIGGKVWMQRFNGLGAPSGAVIFTGLANATLLDVTLTQSVAVAVTFASTLQVRLLGAADLNPLATLAAGFPGTSINSAQLDATSGDGRILLIWSMFRGTGGFTVQSGI